MAQPDACMVQFSQGHPLADPRLLTLATGTNSLMNSFCTSHTGPHWSLELVQNSQDTCGHQVLGAVLAESRKGRECGLQSALPAHALQAKHRWTPQVSTGRRLSCRPIRAPAGCLCNQLQPRLLTAAQQHNTPAASWAGCPANP